LAKVGDYEHMHQCWRLLLYVMALFVLPNGSYGGGSGLNVVVVVNQNSTNSVQLGNYFCEKRGVPPQNLLRISWPGDNISWASTDLGSYLLDPLNAMLATRQLTNQIDYVVLCMDIPFQVLQSTPSVGEDSTTSVVFYGFKTDLPAPQSYNPSSCNLPTASTNSYAASESVFRLSTPTTATTNAFLAVMITGPTLDQAKAIIDRGVASDYSFPTQTVILGHSSDPFRNVRYITFDNAIFNTRLRGNYSMVQSNMDPPIVISNALGYQNGHYQFTISQNAFVPGAIADSLTSYGGVIFGANDHTTLLALIGAGASAGYGTVVEPCNYLEKFPSPEDYFYQARGFSIAEAYYQSVTNPYQGLIVGEPLAAPFGQPGVLSWNGLPASSLLAGTTNLSLTAVGANTVHPIQEIDLFVDGLYFQTITNIPPRTNNVLSVTINGFPTNFTVPAGSTIKSVASNLAVRLGGAGYMAATKVRPYTHGDRIELQSTDSTKSGGQVSVSVTSSQGSATTLATYVNASRGTFLDTSARGIQSFNITNIPNLGDFLQLVAVKTNGQVVSVSVTNTTSGNTMAQFGKAFFATINTNVQLSGPDGLVVEDIVMHEDYAYAFGPNDHSGDVDIHPRSPGWPQSQIKVRILGSATFTITPTGTNTLDANLPDLYPRDHLYVTAGLTNLPVTFGFNTTNVPDGYHQLTAVAYEGSHVGTQTRASQDVRIQNSTQSATFTLVSGGTNSDLGATLVFSVVANPTAISKIELFSTGGSLSNVTGSATALFSVPGTNMGLGLHPFYALVTATSGMQYRTDTKWVRFLGTEPPFVTTISGPPPTLKWPATAGRSYDILTAPGILNTLTVRDIVVPSNSVGQWTDTNATTAQRYYRVRTSN
jgi:uncharacterized protein (TIGR03790 family)